MSLNESIVEDAAISWFAQIGYTVGHGPNIAPAEPGAERTSFADVILKGRLRDAIHRLNPQIPEEAQEEALRKVLRLESSTFVGNNARSIKCFVTVSKWNTADRMARSPVIKCGCWIFQNLRPTTGLW